MRYLHGIFIAGLLLAGRMAAGEEVVIAGFDKGVIPQSAAGEFSVVTDPTAPKDPFLRYKAEGKSGGLVNLPVPKDKSIARFASLRARFRGGEAPDDLRWFAVDADRRVLFQCRVALPAGRQWQEMTFSFADWRWGGEFVGDWSEVRTIVLRAENENPAFDLDDVRLAGDAPANDLSVVTLAFAGGGRVIEKEGLVVATDAVEQITPPEQERMLRRMQQVRAFLKRVVPEAVRPTRQNAFLLIFAEPKQDEEFFARLGERWRTQIVAPTESGYTVQSIATSAWNAAAGADRPTYFHEGVHAVVATDCRLIVGTAGHTALQEGLANYLQLALYPSSLKEEDMRTNFSRPIDPSGKGFFKPLNKLLSERITTRQYVQLATVVGYLVENDPKVLAAWMRAAAGGRNAEDALKAAGTTVAELESKWWEWGTARYMRNRDPKAGYFHLPPEFAEPALTPVTMPASSPTSR